MEAFAEADKWFLSLPACFFFHVWVFFSPLQVRVCGFLFFVLMTVTVQQTETEPTNICVKASNKKIIPISQLHSFSSTIK